MANVKEMCDEMVERIETANREFNVLLVLHDELRDRGYQIDIESTDYFTALQDYEDYDIEEDFFELYTKDENALSQFAEALLHGFAKIESFVESKITSLEDLRIEANYYLYNSESY